MGCVVSELPRSVTAGRASLHVCRVSPITIATLREQAGEKPLLAAIHAQLQSRATRSTKTGKPYLELAFADATGHFSLKVWSDSPIYQQADALPAGNVFRLEGKWTQNSYGIEGRDLAFHQPDEAALNDFFAGDPVIREKQDRDFAEIRRLCDSITDPRLIRTLPALSHPARRPLPPHRRSQAQPPRAPRRAGRTRRPDDALRRRARARFIRNSTATFFYPAFFSTTAGSSGKTPIPSTASRRSSAVHGEMMGHIPLGIELVNKLWRDLVESPEAAVWGDLKPASEDVRLHLLHLIGSHHGEHQFGSPVLPRTPEAFALHYIDNLDAKLEMLRDAYTQTQEIAPNIFERVFPLPTNLIRPLPSFVAASGSPDDAD